MKKDQKILFIRGLPGSGKSTLAKSLVESGEYDAYFEADMYFERDGEYKFDPSQLKYAHQWCFDQFKKNVSEGKSVIISNTFTTRKEISNYLNFCGQIYPYKVLTCKNNYGSIHNVPEETIQRMKQRWEDL